MTFNEELFQKGREGFEPAPDDNPDAVPSYRDCHYDRAREELSRLEREHGIIVHRHWLDKDGWMDGMRICYAIIETPSRKLLKLHWHDGNQDFMVEMPSGGAGSLTVSDLK